MKHLIIGTAGHVDHGKTLLVEALTGHNLDTYTEEKKRGITINPGFTNLKLKVDGEDVDLGIVDVPGHRDFIRNMISGASGLDIVMVVIGLDRGVEKQTIEHIRILQSLGVQNALCVFSRCDLVEEEDKEELKTFILDELTGTFLENSPHVMVSSKTGEGIENLKKILVELYRKTMGKPNNGIFKLYIDRSFSKKGHGTIVTGSVLSGQSNLEKKIYLLPGGEANYIKNIQRHGKNTESVRAGDRCAINITGLDKILPKGSLVVEKQLRQTQMIDAVLKLYPNCVFSKKWNYVMFYTGTYESIAKFCLLEKNRTENEEEVLVQLFLENPAFLSPEDRFVIRATTGIETLAGGKVLNVAPLHHKRRTAKMIESLQYIQQNGLIGLALEDIKNSKQFLDLHDFAINQNLAFEQAVSLDWQREKNVFLLEDKEICVLTLKEIFKKIKVGISHSILEFREENPLKEGMSSTEIFAKLVKKKWNFPKKNLESILNKMLENKEIFHIGNLWTNNKNHADIDESLKDKIASVKEYLTTIGVKIFTPKSLVEEFITLITEKEIYQILKFMCQKKEAVKFDDQTYIVGDVISAIRDKLLPYLHESGEGITIAAFRDLIGSNRKTCLLLIDYYEREGLVKRNGDFRFLTEKGKKFK